MSPKDLLAVLRARGVRVTAHGDRLRVVAPRGVLTPELLEMLAVRKSELLLELRPWACCMSCGQFAFPAPTVCFWCRDRRN